MDHLNEQWAGRPRGSSVRSAKSPHPILHLARQADDGKWRTLCNGGQITLAEGDGDGRPCIKCDAERLRGR